MRSIISLKSAGRKIDAHYIKERGLIMVLFIKSEIYLKTSLFIPRHQYILTVYFYLLSNFDLSSIKIISQS